MYPDQDYAGPKPSFGVPVVPPNVDPDSTPTKSVAVSCAWLPYIRGALYQLLLQATWKTDPAGLDLVQGRVFNLIDLFTECAEATIPFSCPGDLTLTSDPFGTWVTACGLGAWTPSVGWESTHGSCGCFYAGVDINIAFSSPILLTNVGINFDILAADSDLSCGPDSVWVGCFDLDNGHWIGSTLASGAVSPGLGQHLDTGPDTAQTSNIHVVVLAGEANSDPGLGSSASRLTALSIQGQAVNPPC